MPPLLRCGPFEACDGEGRSLFAEVEVALDEGELVLLEGPSGAGKSTLLRQLGALAQAPSAARRLRGEAFGAGRLARWRSQVTLLAQDAPMLPGTVSDNLRFAFAFHNARAGTPGEDRQREALGAVDLLRVPLERDVATLSGGERHRLALARALLWDPSVLLADEPLAGLDPERAALCFDRLAELARRPGHAVLCVLHKGGLGLSGDRRLRLDAGRLAEA